MIQMKSPAYVECLSGVKLFFYLTVYRVGALFKYLERKEVIFYFNRYCIKCPWCYRDSYSEAAVPAALF